MAIEQPPERRSSNRLDMEKELISINWLDQQDKLHQRDVMCLDVSQGGLKISLERDLPLDTQVNIQFKARSSTTKVFKAVVLRSQLLAHGWYDIGLQLID